jgi:hypothetical protein
MIGHASSAAAAANVINDLRLRHAASGRSKAIGSVITQRGEKSSTVATHQRSPQTRMSRTAATSAAT